MIEVQKQLEQEAYDVSVIKSQNLFNKNVEDGRGSETNEGIILIKRTIPPVANKINEYLTSKSLRGASFATREPIMDYLDNEETLAYMVLSAIMNNTLNTWGGKYPLYNVPLLTVARSILTYIKQEYKLELFKGKAPKLNKYIDEKYRKLSVRRRTNKKMMLGKKKMELGNPDNIQGLTLGINLIDAVIKSNSGLVQTVVIKTKGNKKRTLLRLTDATIAIIEQMRDLSPFFTYSYPIFVVKPKEWKEFSGNGGYYGDFLNIDLVKMHNDRINRKMVKGYFDAHPEFSKRYMNIVNAVQRVPWKVNTKVLKVLTEVYDKHLIDFTKEYSLIGGVADDDLPNPYDIVTLVEYDENNKEPYIKYREEIMKLEDKFNTLKSKGLVIKLAMNTARKYSKYENIYFSYQVDFRGRLYPIQPHLNPQGAKTVKSLLMFAEGKPLDTEEAIKWFKIHGANVFGYDKELFPDRVRLIEEMTDEICKIAQDPLVNTKWTDADEPYIFLAWCFEYAAWISNPRDFKSHIPIALDATCSGIQIYSGLMKDNKGAKAVNVVNSDNNQSIADIYGEVATCVNKYLETLDYPKTFEYTTSDKQSHSVDFGAIGNSMAGKINRKITKRNTMTFPYNVSTFGMKDQVMDDIIEPYEGTKNQFWLEGAEKWQVATLLSKLNYRGIGEVVEGAVVCRDFLKGLTKEVVAKGSHIFYKTPVFGFPVVHRIVKYKTTRVTTALAKLSIRTPTTQLDGKKMVNGIAPNYVHSLDATLMFRTVERLLQRGVTSFALIHDSYGVHASDTPKLAEEVREAYIEIFDDTPLYDFVEQTAPFKALEVQDIMINDLDLSRVRDSAYIFS
jgi:DNA-directed RNA polymerase